MSNPFAREGDRGSEAQKYRPLVVVLIAAATGIVVDRFWPMPAEAWWTVVAVAWLAWFLLRCLRLDAAAALAVLLSVAALGGTWHHLRWSAFAADDVGLYARQVARPACLEAIARTGPRRVPAPPFDPMRIVPEVDRTRLEVDVVAIRDGARWRTCSGRATLQVDGHLLGVHAGDRLRVFAQLLAPAAAANPGQFDFARYARAERTLALLAASYPDGVTVVRAGGWGLGRLIEEIRTRGDRMLSRYVSRARSGLAAAVLLGAREQVDPEQTEAFMETGTIHLLAISGLHVGILVLGLAGLMRLAFVPQRTAVVLIALVVVLYALVTDARPPAIRATVLVVVLSLAVVLRRPGPGFNALAAAGLIVLGLNPADLFRTGPQLSFLAVAGLFWFAPHWLGAAEHRDPLEQLIARSHGWVGRGWHFSLRFARNLFLIGLTIWLLALPLVMARFHLVAPVALVLNVFLWVPMLAALACGFGVLALGTLTPPLAAICGVGCDASLALLEWAVHWAREVPGGHAWVPGPSDWWLIGWYGCLGLLAALPRWRPPPRWCVALLAAWTAVGVMAGRAGSEAIAWAGCRSERPRLECTFLAVGHGCAVVLHLPDGRTMLYDAGRMGAPLGAARTVAGYLWSRGITHLDAVVISHADADHYNALPGLVDRVSIGVVYVSPVMFDGQTDSRALTALRRILDQSGVPIRPISASDRLALDQGVRIEVLSPPRHGLLGTDNANSLVLAVQWRGRRILLTGDIESPGLDDLLAEEPWDCDILLVPHHGSRKSSPAGLVQWCRPEWAVLSATAQVDSHSTEAFYRAGGSEVLHTGRQGAVRAVLGPEGVEIERFRTNVDGL